MTDIDVNYLSEAINDKADRDLGNLETSSLYNLPNALEEYAISTSGTICTLNSRKYYKSNTEKCYAAIVTGTSGAYQGPMLIGETSTSVTGYNDYNQTPGYNGTFTHRGKTWYYGMCGHSYMATSAGIDSSKIKFINIDIGTSVSSIEAALPSIMDYMMNGYFLLNKTFTTVEKEVAKGGTSIAGTYDLGFTDNKIKLGVFRMYLTTTGNSGLSTMAIGSDVIPYHSYLAANNAHADASNVVIPFITKVTIGFPSTGVGVGSSTTVNLIGYM